MAHRIQGWFSPVSWYFSKDLALFSRNILAVLFLEPNTNLFSISHLVDHLYMAVFLQVSIPIFHAILCKEAGDISYTPTNSILFLPTIFVRCTKPIFAVFRVYSSPVFFPFPRDIYPRNLPKVLFPLPEK